MFTESFDRANSLIKNCTISERENGTTFNMDSHKNLDKLLVKGFNKIVHRYENSKKKIINEVELQVLNGTKNLGL